LNQSLKNLKKSKNRCFACGEANSEGLRLKFQYDQRTRRASTELRLHSRYQGATGFAHGGIIATLLDEAMAKANGMAGMRAVTVRMNVVYRKMVPLRRPLILSGWRKLRKGRKLYLRSELRDRAGILLAEASGLFLQV
jgi:acyl-coenzyme A thioesterase PaaI-like protein